MLLCDHNLISSVHTDLESVFHSQWGLTLTGSSHIGAPSGQRSTSERKALSFYFNSGRYGRLA